MSPIRLKLHCGTVLVVLSCDPTNLQVEEMYLLRKSCLFNVIGTLCSAISLRCRLQTQHCVFNRAACNLEFEGPKTRDVSSE